MLATNRHPSSTFLILKIIFSKKKKGETNPPQRATDKRGGKREEAKERRREETGKETEIPSPTVSALVPNVQKLKSKSAHKALQDFFKHASPKVVCTTTASHGATNY